MTAAYLAHHLLPDPGDVPPDDLDVSLASISILANSMPAHPVAQNRPAHWGRAFFLVDLAALLAAFVSGGAAAWSINMVLRDGRFQDIFSVASVQQFLIFAGLGMLALLWMDGRGHYRQRLPYWEKVGQILRVALVGLVVGGFIQFAMKNDFSRLWLGFSWISFAVFLCVGRMLVRKHLQKIGEWHIPALMVGNGRTADAARRALQREYRMGFDIVGHITAEQLATMLIPHAWQHVMTRYGAAYLFIALEGGEMERHQHAIQNIAREKLAYSLVPPWLGLPSSTLSPHHFVMNDVMMFHNTNRLTLPLPRLMKRNFDMLVAGMGLLLVALPMLIIGLRVRRDGGPALFRQTRIGMDGKPFSCLKFRSMCKDAEKTLKHHLSSDPQIADEWRRFQKLKDDPRITPFGEWLRRTSLDELPQLINVLRGEMSLVGPRPIMSGQEPLYGDDFTYYTSVRPGITGPWQVSGRNRLTFEERVALEAWYARNWTLWLDIVIMCKTIPVVLRRDAY